MHFCYRDRAETISMTTVDVQPLTTGDGGLNDHIPATEVSSLGTV